MIKEKRHQLINAIVVAICFIVVSTTIIFNICLNPLTPQKVYSDNLNSVVEIKAVSQGVGESYGTAVFIDKDGTLITNAHVVTYKKMGELHIFDNYEIRFATENKYRAVKLLKYDEKLDLAILSFYDKCDFIHANFGNSDKLKAGDRVYAVGNALNYGISITQGIVSVPLLQMEYEGTLRKVIQCDLTINEGNSGGALFDERGKLIGITTFRTKDNMGNVVYGIAYCIPINVVKEFIQNR